MSPLSSSAFSRQPKIPSAGARATPIGDIGGNGVVSGERAGVIRGDMANGTCGDSIVMGEYKVPKFATR